MGEFAQAASPYAPYIMGAASMGMQAYQAREAQKAQQEMWNQQQQAAQQNMKQWQKMAYPSGAAVKSAGQSLKGQLGQARIGAYQNLSDQMAARGFGPGSGLMARGAGQIESGYMKSLADALTDLTKYATTAQFPPTGSAYYSGPTQTTQTPIGAIMGAGSNYLDTAYGFMLMNQLLKNKQTPREYESVQGGTA